VAERFKTLADAEYARRSGFPSRLHRSADAYLVARDEGRTVVAGFPWFTDWGRDTFIAMRGLLLASGRHEAAEAILLEWANTLSEGMLPNRFPDYGSAPEYNAIALVRCCGARLSRRGAGLRRHAQALATGG